MDELRELKERLEKDLRMDDTILISKKNLFDAFSHAAKEMQDLGMMDVAFLLKSGMFAAKVVRILFDDKVEESEDGDK